MPTLEEFARALFADPLAPRRQVTTDRYERSYDALIHEPLGDHYLDDLTPLRVRTWTDDVVRLHGTRDCGMFAHKTVKWLLNEAVDAGLIETNVAAGIKFGRRAQAAVRGGAPSAKDYSKKKPALNRVQYEQLLDYARTTSLRNLLLVRLAVEGTLRRAELTGLRWHGFDPARRVFAVSEGVTATKKTGIVVGELKTDASRREIVLSRDLCDLLTLHRLACDSDAKDAHFLFSGRVPGRRVLDPGRPQHPESTGDQAVALIEQSGLLDVTGKPLTNLHGLRATGSSIALAAGIPPAIIEAQLGHSGRGLLERHYRDVTNAPERFGFADLFEPHCADDLDQELDQAALF